MFFIVHGKIEMTKMDQYCICADCDKPSIMNSNGKCLECGSFSTMLLPTVESIRIKNELNRNMLMVQQDNILPFKRAGKSWYV